MYVPLHESACGYLAVCITIVLHEENESLGYTATKVHKKWFYTHIDKSCRTKKNTAATFPR